MSLMDDHDAVAHAQNFRQFRRNHNHSHASCGHVIDNAVDFLLCADVHASGGLVQNQDLGIGVDPLSQNNLLLVTAGQVVALVVGTKAADTEFVDTTLDQCSALALGQDTILGNLTQIAQLDILGNALFQQQTFGLTVLGDETDAGFDCLLGVLNIPSRRRAPTST